MRGLSRRISGCLVLAMGLLLSQAEVMGAGLSVPSAPTETRHGEDATAQLLTGQRVMQTFDFEERRMHYEDVPMYWKKVAPAEGFPHYAEGKLDTSRHRSGEYSFQLISEGGSVGFEYDPRRIHAKPGSDFQVTAYVSLAQARTARAQMSCTLTDRSGRLIEGSRNVSPLIGAEVGGSEGWARLEVYIPGNFPEAKFLTIGLWVLQEEQWNADAMVEPQIYRRDVHAVAWFDDITVYQLPRVILRTDPVGNVFERADAARLFVEVEAVGALDYQTRLTVRDAAGEVVQEESWLLTGVESAAQDRVIELKDLRAGRYRAELAIMSSGLLVASRELTFLQLAPLTGPFASSGKGFGILTEPHPLADWATTMRLTRSVNSKLVKMPVWRRRSEEGGAIFSQPDFDKKLIDLQQSNVEFIAVFSEVPDDLAIRLPVGRRSLLDVLSQDISLWREPVAYILAQYARQIPYWQIGEDFSGQDRYWDPRVRKVVDTLRREFDKVVGTAVLAVPINGLVEVHRAETGTPDVALYVSARIAPEQLPGYLADMRDRGLDRIWVTMETLDPTWYDRENLLIDFAKRVVFAKKGQARAIFIRQPWRFRQVNARLMTEPSELFVVFRTLADQLGNANYVGEFMLSPDIPALIFEREGQGCLFAWNANDDGRGPAAAETVDIFLGENPSMVDLFGNRTAVPTEKGLSQVRITPWPVVLTDIDLPMALWRAGLHLSPQAVDASVSRQELLLTFVNPFGMPISGKLRFLVGPLYQNNWSIEPRVCNFVLQGQETFQQSITLKLPRNELGGDKQLDMMFHIDADRSYALRAAVPFATRLSGIDVSIFARRENQRDMVVQLVVTNESDEEVSLNSFLDLPDGDHRERVISRLPAGASVSKSFGIRNAVQWLGQYLRVGLYDPKGARRTNYHVEIN